MRGACAEVAVAAVDEDTALHVEVKNAAHAVVTAVQQLREGELRQPDARLSRPRPK